MTVVLFFAVLFVLILVHEWGHFIAAKKTGMRVDEFGIGFPPKLYGVKKGETEYTFNALPIGGFVKILGENSEEDTSDNAVGRSFTDKSKLSQAIVLVAGVTMNILFAWLVFVVVFMHGFTAGVSEDLVNDQSDLIIAGVLEESPAANAGLEYGDVVTHVQAASTELDTLTPTAFREFTQAHSGEEITLTLTDGEIVTITPQTGLVPDAPEQAVVGVALSLQEIIPPQPIYTAVVKATGLTFDSLIAITSGVTNLIVGSINGSADFSQVAGPVGIAGMVGEVAELGLIPLLMFTAGLSLSLAVINLFPFPALDGGRLVMVAIEAVTKKPIDPTWVGRLNLVGFALLMFLMIVVTYNDILRIL